MAPEQQPRTERGRRTRERIVGAAVEVVAERGVAGASLDVVRERAGASKSQLYHYFNDREALLRAVAQASGDTVLGLQDPFFADLDTLDGIAAWMDALVALQVRREARGGCPIGTLAGQLAEQDDGARTILADAFTRWEAPIRAGLEAMQARGELREGTDPAALATQTLAAVQGGLLLTQVRRDPRQLRIALDGALAAIRAACR